VTGAVICSPKSLLSLTAAQSVYFLVSIVRAAVVRFIFEQWTWTTKCGLRVNLALCDQSMMPPTCDVILFAQSILGFDFTPILVVRALLQLSEIGLSAKSKLRRANTARTASLSLHPDS